MTTDDILMVRIRLTEADIVIGQMLAERDAATVVAGQSSPTPLLSFTHLPMVDNIDYHPTEDALPTATPQGADGAGGNPRNPALQGTVRRPVTRGATRNPPAIRASASQHVRRPTRGPVISAECSSDED